MRRKAFTDALNHWGLPSDRTVEGNHKADGGMDAARTLLKRSSLPTAILCSNDLTAIGALSALEKAGIRVPEDVSVVGFDDIYLANLSHPPLTTINLQEIPERGYKASSVTWEETSNARSPVGAESA